MKELDLLFKYCGSGQAMSSKIQKCTAHAQWPLCGKWKMIIFPFREACSPKGENVSDTKLDVLPQEQSFGSYRQWNPSIDWSLTGRNIPFVIYCISVYTSVLQSSCRTSWLPQDLQLSSSQSEVLSATTAADERWRHQRWRQSTCRASMLAGDDCRGLIGERWTLVTMTMMSYRDVAFVEHNSAASPSTSSSGSRNIHQHSTGISFTILNETFLNIWLLLIIRGENTL